MDIDHTEDKKYFHFDPKKFTPQMLEDMNVDMEASHRRLVVITDPHIKNDPKYDVYSQGVVLENPFYGTPKQKIKETNFTSIFVKNNKRELYVGQCWPGKSSWVDFLNENA